MHAAQVLEIHALLCLKPAGAQSLLVQVDAHQALLEIMILLGLLNRHDVAGVVFEMPLQCFIVAIGFAVSQAVPVSHHQPAATSNCLHVALSIYGSYKLRRASSNVLRAPENIWQQLQVTWLLLERMALHTMLNSNVDIAVETLFIYERVHLV